VQRASERKTAPDFTLSDASGNPVKLSDFQGKVVLLNFWATWCGPCKVEIPWFDEFQEQYSDRDFVVLGVSMDEDGWKSVQPYVKEHKIGYRVAVGNDEVAKLYGGVESLPTTMVIDRAGRIASTHEGLCPRKDYEGDIKALLAER
jgi:cytochrome c biogenesis protein CcmG/thiol:disulfide interchange protein DsbE